MLSLDQRLTLEMSLGCLLPQEIGRSGSQVLPTRRNQLSLHSDSSCRLHFIVSEDLSMAACVRLCILLFLRNPCHVWLGRRLTPPLVALPLLRVVQARATRLQFLAPVVVGTGRILIHTYFMVLCLGRLVAQKLRLIHKLLFLC